MSGKNNPRRLVYKSRSRRDSWFAKRTSCEEGTAKPARKRSNQISVNEPKKQSRGGYAGRLESAKEGKVPGMVRYAGNGRLRNRTKNKMRWGKGEGEDEGTQMSYRRGQVTRRKEMLSTTVWGTLGQKGRKRKTGHVGEGCLG